MENNIINVCLSADDNYSKYAGVVIASILNNANEDDNINIFILDGNITEENKQKILSLKNIKNCEIKFVEIDEKQFEIYTSIPTHAYISLPAYYRLNLPVLLPDIKRVIYLDCDTIVNTSLRELINADLGENIIGGVLDTRVKHKRKWKNTNYINSGMVLFDLEKLRTDEYKNIFADFTREHSDMIKTGDQDIINFALKDKIKILHDDWNVQISGFASRTSFTNHPKIIHFISADKPWIFGSKTVFKKFYFENLQLTAWALKEEEKEYWYVKNKWVSTLKFIKQRPYCLISPKYWYAFYCMFIKSLIE